MSLTLKCCHDGLDVARATPARLHIANAADVELGGHDETASRNAARNDVLAPHVMPVARNSVMD